MGAALDEGKVIPKNDPTGHGFGRGLERLLELFPAWFNTWEWKGGHYAAYTQDKNKDNLDDYASFKNQGDYTYDNQTQFNQQGNCGLYPKEGCNPKANVYPSPPKIYSLKLKDSSKLDSGYTWGKANAFTVNDSDSDPVQLSSNASTAILRFFAYADNDQMPIVRLAVDWGDGSDPYVMQGWFKNRKPYCQTEKFTYCSESLSDNKPNRPCQEDNDCKEANSAQPTCKINVNFDHLYFGNSLDAREEKYYQFTHIYECKSGGAGWNAFTKSCKFTPRVQALDNWGWCNGTCNSNGVSGGCWDDPAEDEKIQSCSIKNKTTKDKHWTEFSSEIIFTP